MQISGEKLDAAIAALPPVDASELVAQIAANLALKIDKDIVSSLSKDKCLKQ